MELVKQICEAENTNLCIIPSSLTSIFQPLNVYLNKPFKDQLCYKWNEWMYMKQYNFTKGGNLEKPECNVICKWILEVWNDIPVLIVKKSFKKCSISNALDSIEDDLIWNNEEEIEDSELEIE